MGKKGKGKGKGKGEVLFEAPDPRRMAGRPVDWMVDIMVEGGVVPVVVSMDLGIEKLVEVIPMQHSQYSL